MPFAVIWDVDGVLIDSGPAHFRAWRALASEYGRSVSAEEFRETFGMRNEEMVAHLFGNLSEEAASEMIARKEANFRSQVEAGLVTTQPGARELLDALVLAGVRQAVATSAPPRNLDAVLDTLGLASCFQAIVTSADVKVGKPDPEVFVLAARRLEMPPDRCVVLEDAVVGVAAAQAAGARCVGLVGANDAEQLAAADLVVASLGELSPARLEGLFGGGGCAIIAEKA
jgi:beta-phosphoglucomutase